MKCEICNRDIGIKGFSLHLKIHNITSKEYYDKYLKKDNEGACLKCGKITKFNKLSKGYYKFCSCKCSANSDNKKEKIKQTNIKKYGVENPGQNNEIKEKIKQTNIKKYGGVGFQVEELYNKAKQMNIKKYGVKHVLQNNKIKEKIKQTNIKKYGVEYPGQNNEIKEKIKQTHLNKYFPKVNELLEYLNLKLISNYNHYRKFIKVQCKICNSIFETTYFNLYRDCGKCPECSPKNNGISNIEKELLEFIKSIESSEIIENSRNIIKPYELDIYIPSKNIAIEFDGLYYHSELFNKDKNYHLNKTEECLKQNIQLIHIFEDEWLFKQDIVRSRLKQILGLNCNLPKIYARKCEIKEINSNIKNSFLEKYHIQGEDKSNIKLGAFYNNELISIMTFSKGSISKGSKNIENIYELSRFCSNHNYHIPGIASKLLNYFKNNYEWKEIFSYADRRWSQGNVYFKIGFELSHITKPNYWYVKNGIRIHRFNLRKKSNEPKDIPEWILRLKEGYNRIYDCGHYKFKLRD